MKHIVLFGDSITWGANDFEKGGWAEQLKLFGFENDLTIYNCGISGDTTQELKKRIICEFKARELRHEKEILIVIAMGINDARYINKNNTPQLSTSDFKNNINEIYNLLSKEKYFDVNNNLLFIGPTNVNEKLTLPWKDHSLFWKNNRISDFNNIIKEFCFSKHLPFLDINGLLSIHDLSDGLHPNVNGHKIMFTHILEFLKDNKLL